MNDQLPDYKRKDVSSSRIEFEITVPQKLYKEAFEKELKNLSKDTKIKGFRPGKAPDDMVKSTHGQEAQQRVMNAIVPVLAASVIKKEDIQSIAAPVVYEVNSLDENKGIVFTAIVTVIPDFTIPDLKKIKVEREEVKVESKEVEGTLKQLWQDHKGEFKNMDDKWVKEGLKSMGFKSETLEDLKKEIKDAVKFQKERVIWQKYGSEVLTAAIKAAKIEVPEFAVKYEADERERSFNKQLEQMKVTADQFCKIRNISMDQLKEQWKKDSQEAIENDVFLKKYAETRKVEITEDELLKEVELIKTQSKDKSSDLFDNPQWREYIRRVMLKRRAFSEFLKEVDPNSFSEATKSGAVSAQDSNQSAKSSKTQNKSSK